MTITTVITMSHAKTIALAMLLTMAVATMTGTMMATSFAMTTTFSKHNHLQTWRTLALINVTMMSSIVQGVRQWRVRSPTCDRRPAHVV